MEAVPLSDTSAAACAKALTFSGISGFGVPKTITSDRGLQFTSNLWFKLCEMLNISHRQTTAYHPESNGCPLRLCRRGDLVRGVTFCAPRTPRKAEGNTGLSLAEALFGAPIVLPNEFLQNDEIAVDTIIKIFSKTLDVPAVSLPRDNSSAQPPSKLPAELLSAPLAWVCRGGVVPPFQPLYDSPTPFYAVAPAPPFTVRVGSRDEIITVSSLRPAW